MEKLQQLVAIQKDIKLATGESVDAYARKVREAGYKFIKQKLNIPSSSPPGGTSTSVYPIEIFSKSAIFSVYQYGPNVDDSQRSRYFAAAYSRDDDGKFEFSNLTEVEQVVGYQPKSSTTVTKAAVDAVVDEPGWRPTSKSLWNGVL